MVEELPNASFRAVLDHIHTHFADFLRLPHYKQMNLAEKAVAVLVMKQRTELLHVLIYVHVSELKVTQHFMIPELGH